MPAFNSRLKPRKIGHIPLYAVLGLLGMLITGVLSVVLPSPVHLLFGVLFFGCVFATAFFLWAGDELPFICLKIASHREKNAVSSETWTDA